MSERLAAELAALEVAWPPTPDIASAVLAQLEARPRVGTDSGNALRPPVSGPSVSGAGDRRTSARRVRWRPAVAWVMAALVAACGITLAASPSARSAILEWLGLKSVKIERKAPTATPQPQRGQLGENLLLGDAVPLDEARRRAGFRIRVPAALPAPDAVYYDAPPPPGGRVSFVYRPQPGINRTPQTGTGLLVSEWPATVTPVIEKAAGGSKLDRFRIGGDRAYFISGPSHGMAWVDENGDVDFEDQRLAGNTLLVERADGLLLRVEGDLDRDAAVRIARSLR
jgi:hypothetical protein